MQKKCFDGRLQKAENLKLAEDYWKSGTDEKHQPKICEMLVDGDIVVVEIVKEINANIKLLRIKKSNFVDIPENI